MENEILNGESRPKKSKTLKQCIKNVSIYESKLPNGIFLFPLKDKSFHSQESYFDLYLGDWYYQLNSYFVPNLISSYENVFGKDSDTFHQLDIEFINIYSKKQTMKLYGNPKQLKTLNQYFQSDSNLLDYPFVNELNELKEKFPKNYRLPFFDGIDLNTKILFIGPKHRLIIHSDEFVSCKFLNQFIPNSNLLLFGLEIKLIKSEPFSRWIFEIYNPTSHWFPITIKTKIGTVKYYSCEQSTNHKLNVSNPDELLANWNPSQLLPTIYKEGSTFLFE